MTDSLALIDRARKALDEARTLDDVKDVRDMAAAAQHYASKRKGAEEAERFANEIRLQAERKIGELTREMEKAPSGRAARVSPPTKGSETKTDVLARVGIETQDASRFERIAAIPPAAFEREVVKPEATTRGLARLGSEGKRPTKRERVKVAAPSVDEKIIAQRVRAFRSDVERLVRKHTARWPENAPRRVLAEVLSEIAGTILTGGE